MQDSCLTKAHESATLCRDEYFILVSLHLCTIKGILCEFYLDYIIILYNIVHHRTTSGCLYVLAGSDQERISTDFRGSVLNNVVPAL